MRESANESIVNTWAKENGIRHFKQNGSGQRGKSDQYYLRKGKIAFAEMKATGKRATALQEKKLKEHRDDGFAAEWFDDPIKAIRFLKEHLL